MAHSKFSFEFFPPKSAAMEKRLWDTIDKLEPLGADFVSVTYGAGGSTQKPTFETVSRIHKDTSLKPAAHLTCVGSPRHEIDSIAKMYWSAGIRHIVALRGDPPNGIGQTYVPKESGYAYASDLISGLKSIADFDISVAAYPERHPESPSWDAELDNLKRKIGAGATRAITQFFIKPDVFLSYRDRVRDAGIAIPLVPGIMLQPNFQSLKRMADMCGVTIHNNYADLYDGIDDEPYARKAMTISTVQKLIAGLKAQGVEEFHFYTLNRADIAIPVIKSLKDNSSQNIYEERLKIMA
ncbi:methylenetetrahydrofolate reductase [NAD(P)H] [Hellea balneolensis]|uniref:methylenetetrahydrofolate reductase [NAD(P)H] n=1 Tax=Hellea balneolensis TaxID=287478 RepID=UPI00040B1A55|nr:methylenetetrahydrofolate reductase [NAD(P)H] [Hellea balneolensis]